MLNILLILTKITPKNLKYVYQVWWHMNIIPASGRLRQDNHKFAASLGYRKILSPIYTDRDKL
jgi:hypothetical protein